MIDFAATTSAQQQEKACNGRVKGEELPRASAITGHRMRPFVLATVGGLNVVSFFINGRFHKIRVHGLLKKKKKEEEEERRRAWDV